MWSRDDISQDGDRRISSDKKMFTATDAKRIADEHCVSQLTQILEDIKTAASMGQYSMYLPELDYNARVAVTAQLEQLGFEVSHSSDQRDGSFTTVYWS